MPFTVLARLTRRAYLQDSHFLKRNEILDLLTNHAGQSQRLLICCAGSPDARFSPAEGNVTSFGNSR